MRLKSRKQIDALFEKGKSFHVFPIKVVYGIGQAAAQVPGATEAPAGLQVGFSASKRNFKKAVDRNRIKRLLRETYRLNKQAFFEAAEKQSGAIRLFFIYTDKSLPGFEPLQVKMQVCLGRLTQMMAEQKP